MIGEFSKKTSKWASRHSFTFHCRFITTGTIQQIPVRAFSTLQVSEQDFARWTSANFMANWTFRKFRCLMDNFGWRYKQEGTVGLFFRLCTCPVQAMQNGTSVYLPAGHSVDCKRCSEGLWEYLERGRGHGRSLNCIHACIHKHTGYVWNSVQCMKVLHAIFLK